MYPLLEKDGQVVPYFVLSALVLLFSLPTTAPASAPASSGRKKLDALLFRIAQCSLALIPTMHIFLHFLPHIPRYPDLPAVLLTALCAAKFVFFWLVCTYLQLTDLVAEAANWPAKKIM
jgi:hypothetical protein